MRFGGGGGT
ncbi:hypothetical protein CP99DC5_0273A, partial [Chlamydia psittaci 99DC5]